MTNSDLQIGSIAEARPPEEDAPRLPEQREHWRAPARFGSVPVEEYPLGWDTNRRFEKHYPRVDLPTQIVDRVSFGNAETEPNRLVWGDNLHVMRQIKSNSIDLVYMDPPFFSGRQYNVMWGDANEVRSFNDIWEGGMTGYLIWLNARLYEAKRLLKPTGSIYLHCDWHASHYIKVEMDKIFGFGNLQNEIVWYYTNASRGKRRLAKSHDSLLWYSKSEEYTFNRDDILVPFDSGMTKWRYEKGGQSGKEMPKGKTPDDVLMMPSLNAMDKERVGYPTQKPEALLERIIRSSSNIGDIIADFVMRGGHHLFCGTKTRQTLYWLRSVSRRSCRHRRTTQASGRYRRVWRFTSAGLHGRTLGYLRSGPSLADAGWRFSSFYSSLLRRDTSDERRP